MKNEQIKIGLIVADENEIQQMNEFSLIKEYKLKFNVNLYSYQKIHIYVIHSRIALVNAAVATQYLIDEFKVSQIWNYGSVASCGSNKIFDVVIPNKFYYFDAITPWYKRGQIPNEPEFYLNSFKNNSKYNIASGNSFITDKKYIEELNKEIDVDLIDMESCAIAQTCYLNKIEFYCIKAISDIVGSNNIDKEQINFQIREASKKAFDKMLELLKSF